MAGTRLNQRDKSNLDGRLNELIGRPLVFLTWPIIRGQELVNSMLDKDVMDRCKFLAYINSGLVRSGYEMRLYLEQAKAIIHVRTDTLMQPGNMNVMVLPTHPEYDKVLKYCQDYFLLASDITRARTTFAAIAKHAASAGHYKRILPEVIDLLPKQAKDLLADAKRGSPWPTGLEISMEERRFLVQMLTKGAMLSNMEPENENFWVESRANGFQGESVYVPRGYDK